MNALEEEYYALTLKGARTTTSFNGCVGTMGLLVTGGALLDLHIPLLGHLSDIPIVVISMPQARDDLKESVEKIAQMPTFELHALSTMDTAVMLTEEVPKEKNRDPIASRNRRIHPPPDTRFHAGNYMNPVVPPHIMRRG